MITYRTPQSTFDLCKGTDEILNKVTDIAGWTWYLRDGLFTLYKNETGKFAIDLDHLLKEGENDAITILQVLYAGINNFLENKEDSNVIHVEIKYDGGFTILWKNYIEKLRDVIKAALHLHELEYVEY